VRNAKRAEQEVIGKKFQFEPGTVVAEKYRIVEPIGRGGFGEVLARSIS